VLRVQTEFVIGYSVYTKQDLHTYTLSTCRTHKADVGFNVATVKGKVAHAEAELTVPGTAASNTCYRL
jgi:hypothetical protein